MIVVAHIQLATVAVISNAHKEKNLMTKINQGFIEVDKIRPWKKYTCGVCSLGSGIPGDDAHNGNDPEVPLNCEFSASYLEIGTQGAFIPTLTLGANTYTDIATAQVSTHPIASDPLFNVVVWQYDGYGLHITPKQPPLGPITLAWDLSGNGIAIYSDSEVDLQTFFVFSTDAFCWVSPA